MLSSALRRPDLRIVPLITLGGQNFKIHRILRIVGGIAGGLDDLRSRTCEIRWDFETWPSLRVFIRIVAVVRGLGKVRVAQEAKGTELIIFVISSSC